jgi:hypothetical protein
MQGGLVNPRSAVNEKFYGKKASPKEILFEGAVKVPEGTLMNEVYDKLNKLCSGVSVYEPTADEKQKVHAAFAAAEKEGEEVANSPDVVYVNAEEEAIKEAS